MGQRQLSMQFQEQEDLQQVRKNLSEFLMKITEIGLLEVALNEALNNAFFYRQPQHSAVTLRLSVVNGKRLVARIANEGPGFAAQDLLDKARRGFGEEDLWQESGRGLGIMHAVFDRVLYNKQGTELLLVKKLTTESLTS